MTSDDVAFRLAPPLNASGRMADASLGVLALTTDQPRLAFELAGRLSAMNRERQHIERTIVEEIETQIAAMADLERRRTLVFSGKGWHKGVIGIVASRIAEKYHRPTLVLDVEDGWATGSGRSIPGFNIYRALGRLGHCFEKFGGHHHAVGFTLKASQLPRLVKELENLGQRLLRDRDPVPVLEIEAEIGLSDLSLNSLRRLTAFQPFGLGNPEPLLAARPLQVVHARIVGENQTPSAEIVTGRDDLVLSVTPEGANHLKMKVKQGHHVTEAIGFNLAGKSPRAGETMDLVFTPEINAWQGCERVQLKVVDLAKTNSVP